MLHFNCTCKNTLFFENSTCLQCGNEVGYDPAMNAMRPLAKDFLRCRNGADFGVCNWLVPAGGPEFCAACRLNRTVPDTNAPGNLDGWRKMESAKRRVIYTLSRIGLTPQNKLDDPSGVAFDFLAAQPGQRVMTGHENGVITVNILEAHDPYREQERSTLREPYRTLVGHFRHELGHYYWDRFFLGHAENDPLLTEFRALFGDERTDYIAALAQYYANGPAAAWSATHITAYATAHPWEDWAETWAQYLHIVDGAETATAFGWTSESVPIPFTPFLPDQILADTPQTDATFLQTLNGWAKLAPALNELAASLGHATLYPFVFSPPAVRKILFVHKMAGLAAVNWNQPPPTQVAPAPLAPAPIPPAPPAAGAKVQK